MKFKCNLLVIVFIASLISCGVAEHSKAVADTKKPVVVSKPNGSNSNRVNETVESVNSGNESHLGTTDSREEGKQNKGSELKEKPQLVREKCDSTSNSCTDDDKTLVACLRVPGNESPELSLLIQNKGKDSLSVAISAPDLVHLEKKRVELREKEDTEVKVSITGVERGHLIILTAGHGNCSLNFRDQFVGKKNVDPTHASSNLSILNPTSSTRFLFLAAFILVVIAFVLMYVKFGRSYFTKEGAKYQKLDMELPVSHNSRVQPGENEGWDDGWGNSWDDEEAPKTPTFPVTPSLSSKGIASRKLSKDGWKD